MVRSGLGEAQRTDTSNRHIEANHAQETGTALPTGIFCETSVLPDDFALIHYGRSPGSTTLDEPVLTEDHLDRCQQQLQQDQDCLLLPPWCFSCPASAILHVYSSCV